jgi:hypothetical protein
MKIAALAHRSRNCKLTFTYCKKECRRNYRRERLTRRGEGRGGEGKVEGRGREGGEVRQ